MAKTPSSLILLRRPSRTQPFLLLVLLRRSRLFSIRRFSTSPTAASVSNPSAPAARTSLSARMSSVFDRIDAIEKDRFRKDEALQRIRAWRESLKENSVPVDEHRHHPPVSEPGNGRANAVRERVGLATKKVELVHPWMEWVELMERLVRQNYFDFGRKSKRGVVRDLGFDMSEVAEEALDFTRDFTTVEAACLNFGRHRFDILRSLSRHDIQLLVGYGCPNVEKKVVFSAKLLRKHVHLDEGDVCSSCSLRSSCRRAYLVTNKEDEARTFDLMRVLLAFGFDPVNGLVANKPLLKLNSVKNAIRKILHEVVKLSAVPIDPNLPRPVIKKSPPKVKQLPPPPRKRVGRNDIAMKKGDWLCPKCDLLNFAKNSVCLKCDAKRPDGQLLPGEWECPECNFINYRKNMVCFRCECKRPPDEYTENLAQERKQLPKMRTERVVVANREEVSNAWNFDFDDAESDGADVAAFEFADSPISNEQLDGSTQEGSSREPKDTFYHGSGSPRSSLERAFPNFDHKKSGPGFDDSDDECEIDGPRSSPVCTDSSNGFPEARRYAESKDFDGSGDAKHSRRRMSSSSGRQQLRQPQRKAPVSGSEDDYGVDSDEDFPIPPNWKSRHVAGPGQRRRFERPGGSVRHTNFGSDEERRLGSDRDGHLGHDFPYNQGKGNRCGSRRMGAARGGSNLGDERSYGSDSNDNRFKGSRRGGARNDRESFESSGHTQRRPSRKLENRGEFSIDDFDRPRRRSYDNGSTQRRGSLW